jgi:hypothetical protein
VGKPKGKKPLGRTRRRCEANIKMILHEVRWGDKDCIDLYPDWERWRAVVNAVMNLWVS